MKSDASRCLGETPQSERLRACSCLWCLGETASSDRLGGTTQSRMGPSAMPALRALGALHWRHQRADETAPRLSAASWALVSMPMPSHVSRKTSYSRVCRTLRFTQRPGSSAGVQHSAVSGPSGFARGPGRRRPAPSSAPAPAATPPPPPPRSTPGCPPRPGWHHLLLAPFGQAEHGAAEAHILASEDVHAVESGHLALALVQPSGRESGERLAVKDGLVPCGIVEYGLH